MYSMDFFLGYIQSVERCLYEDRRSSMRHQPNQYLQFKSAIALETTPGSLDNPHRDPVASLGSIEPMHQPREIGN